MYRDGPSTVEGFADDYAFLISGLIGWKKKIKKKKYQEKNQEKKSSLNFFFTTTKKKDLYESTFDVSWLDWALSLQNRQIQNFWSHERGGFYNSKEDNSDLILQFKESKKKNLQKINLQKKKFTKFTKKKILNLFLPKKYQKCSEFRFL